MQYPRPLSEQPPTTDADGANLDPRHCDCGKGAACPLMTEAWRKYLGPLLQTMDDFADALRNPRRPGFAVYDVRDGRLVTEDHDGNRFVTKEQAEHEARRRNEGVYAFAQTWRVLSLEPVPFADVKPRAGE